MEFNEKLQELRNKKGLTQEELAQQLYVSRTAVSKWESGRGYPNIDSLKAIAKFFSVTIDELLSGDELISVSEENIRRKDAVWRSMVFGLLDISAAMLVFLPLFGQRADGVIESVSLLNLAGTAPYLKAGYYLLIALTVISGIINVVQMNSEKASRGSVIGKISLFLSTAGVLLFVISLQPYAASILLIFLIIKALMLIKWR